MITQEEIQLLKQSLDLAISQVSNAIQQIEPEKKQDARNYLTTLINLNNDLENKIGKKPK